MTRQESCCHIAVAYHLFQRVSMAEVQAAEPVAAAVVEDILDCHSIFLRGKLLILRLERLEPRLMEKLVPVLLSSRGVVLGLTIS